MDDVTRELMELGLTEAESRFYVAVLSLGSPTVTQASKEAGITRTNGYEVSEKLARRGLLASTPAPQAVGTARGRPSVRLRANNPEVFKAQWQLQGQVIENVVPALLARAHKQALTPRVRYFEGKTGIRSAIFETLQWDGDLNGIFSMQDLFDVPGTGEMAAYIKGRREHRLWLNVVRSRERDFDDVWPSDPGDYRRARMAPNGTVFTMTTIMSNAAVCIISSRNESFAVIIESREFAATQNMMWRFLWNASDPC